MRTCSRASALGGGTAPGHGQDETDLVGPGAQGQEDAETEGRCRAMNEDLAGAGGVRRRSLHGPEPLEQGVGGREGGEVGTGGIGGEAKQGSAQRPALLGALPRRRLVGPAL